MDGFDVGQRGHGPGRCFIVLTSDGSTGRGLIPPLFAEMHLAVPGELDRAVEIAGDAGRTATLAAWDGQARAVFEIGGAIRPGSAAIVARVRSMGLPAMMITGDAKRVADAVGAELGIAAENVFAGFSPAGKARAVGELQADGVSVAMVGDGVNDSAALAQGDLRRHTS